MGFNAILPLVTFFMFFNSIGRPMTDLRVGSSREQKGFKVSNSTIKSLYFISSERLKMLKENTTV